MNYVEKLKEKYGDDFESAYKEYHYSKSIYRTVAINPKFLNDNTSERESNFQKDFNRHIERVVSGEINLRFNDLDSDSMRNYIIENIDVAQKIKISKSQLISMLSGSSAMRVDMAAKEIQGWNGLEDLINTEKNNNPDMTDNQYQEKLNSFCEKFGFTSVYINKINSSNQNIEKLDQQFSQLVRVMGIQNHQVGLGKMSLDIDTEEVSHAGSYCSQNKVLFLKNSLATDALAHEWFHAVDNLIAEHNESEHGFVSDDKDSVFFELVENSKKQKKEAIDEINKTLINDTKTNLGLILDRELKARVCENPERLKEIVSKEYECIVAKDKPNLDKLKKEVAQLLPEASALPSFIATELTVLKKFVDNKQYEKSLFYEYSQEMQKNLNDIMDYDYSNNPTEMIARMFEAYTDGKVTEMGESNIISQRNNHWIPSVKENQHFEKDWESSIEMIKKNLNQISPPHLKIPEVSSLMKKMKELTGNNEAGNDTQNLLKLK